MTSQNHEEKFGQTDWESLEQLVDHVEITTSDFNAAIEKLDKAWGRAVRRAKRNAHALLGDSHAGKSYVIETFEDKHPKKRTPDGLEAPVQVVHTPVKPERKSFLSAILEAYEDPAAHIGDVGQLRARVRTHIKAAKTRVLIFEEFQRVADTANNEVILFVTEVLAELIERYRICVVITGLRYADVVLKKNEQLRGRLSRPRYMRRHTWLDDEGREEFITVLNLWRHALAAFDLPDLGSEDLAYRFFCASGGLMGYLAKILRQACWVAVDKKRIKITLADLAAAFEEEVHEEDAPFGNPFRTDFKTDPPKDLEVTAARIGLREGELPRARSKRMKAKGSPRHAAKTTSEKAVA